MSITPEERKKRNYSRGEKYNQLLKVLKDNPGNHRLGAIHDIMPDTKIGTLRQLISELRELGYIIIVRATGVKGTAFNYTLGASGHSHIFNEERTYNRKDEPLDFIKPPTAVADKDKNHILLLTHEFLNITTDHIFGSDIHFRRYWSKQYGGIPRKGVYRNYKT